MKRFQGHDYETVENWHPVVINAPCWPESIYLSSWLSEHCPDGDRDYDAWCHPEDNMMEDTHRSVYFFRDQQVAFMFALRW